MATTYKPQPFTVHPPSEGELYCRPLPATLRSLSLLTLPLEAIYSELCFSSEVGSWVAIAPTLYQEVEALKAAGLVEVAS